MTPNLQMRIFTSNSFLNVHRINFVALVQFTWNLMAGDVLAVHYLYDIRDEIITVKITDKQGALRNDM